ncbi:MAG: HARBI1 family protein [Gaiellaceae bacterium]
MRGCVGCLDGLLVRIKTPSKKDAPNAQSFFSGHYQAIGLNVQACCDHLGRFTFLAVAAPGSSSDLRAYELSSLKRMVERLPPGTFVVGDNAYTPSENLLTPFSGSQRDNPKNNNFNFFLSQLRIKIEMAFGLLTNKWRILQSPLVCKLKTSSNVIATASILHNFIINQGDATANDDNVARMFTQEGRPLGYVPSDISFARTSGDSVLRERIVKNIDRMNVARPTYNVNRNANRDN